MSSLFLTKVRSDPLFYYCVILGPTVSAWLLRVGSATQLKRNGLDVMIIQLFQGAHNVKFIFDEGEE